MKQRYKLNSNMEVIKTPEPEPEQKPTCERCGYPLHLSYLSYDGTYYMCRFCGTLNDRLGKVVQL